MSSTAVDPTTFDAFQRAADRVAGVLAELGGQSCELAADVFGDVTGGDEMRVTAQCFDDRLRDELREGEQVVRRLSNQAGQFEQVVVDTDEVNAKGIETA